MRRWLDPPKPTPGMLPSTVVLLFPSTTADDPFSPQRGRYVTFDRKPWLDEEGNQIWSDVRIRVAKVGSNLGQGSKRGARDGSFFWLKGLVPRYFLD